MCVPARHGSEEALEVVRRAKMNEERVPGILISDEQVEVTKERVK